MNSERGVVVIEKINSINLHTHTYTPENMH